MGAAVMVAPLLGAVELARVAGLGSGERTGGWKEHGLTAGIVWWSVPDVGARGDRRARRGGGAACWPRCGRTWRPPCEHRRGRVMARRPCGDGGGMGSASERVFGSGTERLVLVWCSSFAGQRRPLRW